MVKITGDYYTNRGGRKENEDSCLLLFDKEKGICALVADGLGYHGGGAAASQKAREIIYKSFMGERIERPEEFNIWFQEANQEVLRLQTTEIQMKTTLVVLLIHKHNAMWAHIGDSRLYHFVNGELVEQTFDHSVSQMAVLRGDITESEIRGHVDRNRLLRAIGREDTIKIDTSVATIEEGDWHAFLLCTDGFWEYVLEKEMEKDLRKANGPRDWIKRMVKRIKSRTIFKKNDNNTAVAVICRRD